MSSIPNTNGTAYQNTSIAAEVALGLNPALDFRLFSAKYSIRSISNFKNACTMLIAAPSSGRRPKATLESAVRYIM